MKTNIKYMMLAACALGMMACEDSNDGPFMKDGDNVTGENSISLIAPESGGSYILREKDANKTWESFSWVDANTVAIAPMEYYVEVSVEDNELSPALVGPYTTQPIQITEGELNKVLVTLGYTDANTQVDISMRVKQVLGSELTSIEYYSSLVSSSVIVYGGTIEEDGIPVLYVPGAHQGWTPDNAFQVYSNDNDGIYTGYVNFPSGGEEFKFTANPNWDGPNYGNAGTMADLSGTLSDDSGAGNLKLNAAAGAYLLTANLNDMTWSAKATTWEATANSWGLIGDATPSGWDADTDMTFNQSNGLLELTTALTDGEIKFRANDGWDLNYGDTKVEGVIDGIGDKGGDNIAVTAGTYKITLDLRNPAQATYTLVLQ
ncbi:MAG: SusF/SusE family outer membrane protein [Mangrovibacterium sp.]